MAADKRMTDVNCKIDEELVCADALKHVLKLRCGCETVELHPEQCDPPDFTVVVDGKVFPTEVTSIVSDQHYYARCRAFAQAVEDRARTLGALSGLYAIRVSRDPSIPKHNSEDGRSLLEDATAFIGATQRLEESEELLLRREQTGKIFITKLSSSGCAVGLLRVGAAMREQDIGNELERLIQKAVDSKRVKLGKVGIAGQQALLLLYDAHGYADPTLAASALERVNGYDWFHSVFWAASFTDRVNVSFPQEPGREGVFLFSADLAWHRMGTVPLEPPT